MKRDWQALAEKITSWLREQVEKAGAKGLVFGLSGGVDSTTTAALCKRALGGNTLGLLMPCHSNPADEEDARLAAETFGIKTEQVDLTPIYDRLLASLPEGTDIARANLKPRLRMLTLYYFANSLNYLVVGTGNKSEVICGYFTKFGDGGVDLLPLGDLLKSEVWELARFLGVPERIIQKTPSAGLWSGQTDEGEMGITYKALDAVLTALEEGRPEEVPLADLEKVQAMRVASEHKRNMPPICSLT